MKDYLKCIARTISALAVLPLTVSYRITRLFCDERSSFRPYSELLSIFPGATGTYFRRAFYQQTLEACAADCTIGFGTLLSSPRTRIGSRVYIGAQCSLGEVEIGANTMLASGVRVISGTQQHGIDELSTPMRDQAGHFTKISIGEDCWIGEGALIAADIAAHSIVAAGSVVVQAVPEYAIVAGNPAGVIRSRKPNSSVLV